MTWSRPRSRSGSVGVVVALLAAALIVGACDTGLGGSGLEVAGNSEAAASPSFDTSNVEATDEPDNGSEAPAEGSAPPIPGFDGWLLVNGRDVDIGATQGGFAMTLLKRALWSESSEGVLFFARFDGDFRISATVSTSRTSDSSSDPGGGGITQLAGLLARAPSAATESFVLVDSGADAHGLTVETTSTLDGHSTSEQPSWPSGDADLQLCRIGTTFTLWKRAPNSDADYTLAATYHRPDLKGTLEVGADIFSDGPPDITAQFGDLVIETLDPGETC